MQKKHTIAAHRSALPTAGTSSKHQVRVAPNCSSSTAAVIHSNKRPAQPFYQALSCGVATDVPVHTAASSSPINSPPRAVPRAQKRTLL